MHWLHVKVAASWLFFFPAGGKTGNEIWFTKARAAKMEINKKKTQTQLHPPGTNLSGGDHPYPYHLKNLSPPSGPPLQRRAPATHTRPPPPPAKPAAHHPPCVYVRSLSDWYFISACPEPFCAVWLGRCTITGH